MSSAGKNESDRPKTYCLCFSLRTQSSGVPRGTGALPLDPAGGLPSLRTPLLSRKFLATPLTGVTPKLLGFAVWRNEATPNGKI